jgi:aldose 1-epimerase
MFPRLLLASLLPLLPASAQEVSSGSWGKAPDGSEVFLYTLRNANKLEARIITMGATLIGVDVPGRDGKFENVTLYLDDREAYLTGKHPVLGSTIGRYANRIDTGGFTIDGKRHDLDTFNPKTKVHIHGGKTGFAKQNWKASPVEGEDSVGVTLSLVSPDGHEGYPGTVKVQLSYHLNNENELSLVYSATTDKPTHVSLTNHAYWNLGGAGSGTILHHQLLVNANAILTFDKRQIPTGEFTMVDNTPFDFRKARSIGEGIDNVPPGYDHCFVIEPQERTQRLAARVEDPESGRVMEVRTDAPGVQIYTANHISDRFGAGGKSYGKHHAICLECQHFPDTPNHANFPTTLLRPGATYRQTTIHRFGTKPAASGPTAR